MAVRAAAVLCMALALIGCATSRLQDQLREAANHPVSEYRDWPAAQVFAEVSQAAGMDPSKVYLAVTRGIDGANVWSVGDGIFLITPSVRDAHNMCLLLGLASHAIAHDRLGHPEAKDGLAALIARTRRLAGETGTTPFYSRAHEREANVKAVEILAAAGRQPWFITYAVTALKDASLTNAIHFRSTHPPAADRLAILPPLPGDAAQVLLCGRSLSE